MNVTQPSAGSIPTEMNTKDEGEGELLHNNGKPIKGNFRL